MNKDEKDVVNFFDALTEFVNDKDKIKNDLLREISDSIYDDLGEIFDKNISSHFYERYKPKKYRRKKTLYEAYSLKKKKDGSVNYDFGPEYMPENSHRDSNENIFQRSFIEGYHGGAPTINNVEKSVYKQPHPQEGIPYWRKPFPDGENKPYQFWYDTPAPKETISPMKGIEMDLANYETGKSSTSTGVKLEDRIDDAFSSVMGRYELFDILGMRI